MNNEAKYEIKVISFGILCVMICGFLLQQLKPINAASITEIPPVEEASIQQEEHSRPYEKLIHDTFGEDGDIAYAIAQAESHLNPDKCHIDDYEYSCGLFQINLKAHYAKVPGEDFTEKAEWLKIPENNVLIALFIKSISGFRPWSVFTNGVYKDYL